MICIRMICIRELGLLMELLVASIRSIKRATLLVYSLS